MATHSSVLAWAIPWTEEPGGLQCMGLQRVGQNQANNIVTMLNAGKDTEKLNLLHIAGGNVIWHSCSGKRFASVLKN